MKSSQFIKISIFILYLLFIKYSHFLVAKKNQSPKFTLLVIAHPDDEIMFFSPFLLNNKDTFILCLSGDETRKKELNLISKYLKIKHKCINFADGSNWNEKLICFFIQNIYNKYKFERIVTFDSYGVSGHKNHISCFEGVRLFLKNNKVECLFLRSVSVLQKYGLIYSKGNIIFTNSFMQYFYAVKLMFLYKSQLKWFRILWLIFSNFMFVNIFDK